MVRERHAHRQQIRILNSKPNNAHGKVRRADSSFPARQAPLNFYKRYELAGAHQAHTVRRSICSSGRTRCVHTEIGLIDVVTLGEIDLSPVVSICGRFWRARSRGPITNQEKLGAGRDTIVD